MGGPTDRGLIELQAEDVVVGSLLVYGSEIGREVTGRLTPDDFVDPEARAVYEAVLSLAQAGHETDPISVAERLQQTGKLEAAGGLVRLSAMMDASQPGMLAIVEMRRVQRNARLREAERVIRQCLAGLERGADPEVEIQDLKSALDRMGHFMHDAKRYDDMNAMAIRVSARLERGDIGWPWPWQSLTDAVGRIVPGHLYAVSAYSGGGKSTFSRNLALGLEAMGTPTVYYAIEEADEAVLGLIGCAVAGVSYLRYGRGFKLTEREEDQLCLAVSGIADRKVLKINGRKLWAPHEILARTRMYAREGVAKVFVFDHAHLIDYPGRNDQERDKAVGDFAERLHALCAEEGVAGVALYQPRKPGEGGDIFRPVMPDEMAGARRVWNIVENTISPYRPWVEVGYGGSPKLGADGLPVVTRPFSKDSRPVDDYFYVQPGKARIGGYGAAPVVLRFNPVSGLVYERGTITGGGHAGT